MAALANSPILSLPQGGPRWEEESQERRYALFYVVLYPADCRLFIGDQAREKILTDATVAPRSGSFRKRSQQPGIPDRRAVAEADDRRLQLDQGLDGPPV